MYYFCLFGCVNIDDAVADAAVRHGRLKCHLYYLSGALDVGCFRY